MTSFFGDPAMLQHNNAVRHADRGKAMRYQQRHSIFREFGEALEYLERARLQLHDPELELHLGDVLWELGRREDAHATWQAAAMQYPQDNELQERLKRFKGK